MSEQNTPNLEELYQAFRARASFEQAALPSRSEDRSTRAARVLAAAQRGEGLRAIKEFGWNDRMYKSGDLIDYDPAHAARLAQLSEHRFLVTDAEFSRELSHAHFEDLMANKVAPAYARLKMIERDEEKARLAIPAAELALRAAREAYEIAKGQTKDARAEVAALMTGPDVSGLMAEVE